MFGYNQIKKRFYDEFNETILDPFIFAGKISLEESRFLMKLVQEANKIEGPIVEIGSLFGCSSQIIILAKEADKRFISVDNFRWNPLGFSSEKHFSLTKKILSDATENYNVELVKMDKDIFYKQYSNGSPSMVFFDADHSYKATLRDLLWAKKVGAKIICGHDYKHGMPGVIKAVNEVAQGEPKKICESIFLL